ncbi:insulin-like growth factor-binding protein 3 receptor isoform X2 [Bombina bombina]|uniref:insulin-like growth factor-binding protein 3 receptor isoform X2 n=1 Tax=Bombina bombina TaxID=8345 RepID=UPI00235A5C65|nr:insulin-like growth factor-binding protein 3 receptor isoform X2 [Bombina bombina]
MVLFRGLRACIHQYPPLVMFFLCIATLVISFLCLGVYVKTHTVRDADVAQDWDSFILALSMLHFCPKGNMTGNLSNVSELSTVGFRKKSVVAVLGLHPWDSASSSTSLRLAVKGIQLGLKGDREDANMVVTVSRFIETEKCNASDQACITRFCITVFGPESSLPNTRQVILLYPGGVLTHICYLSLMNIWILDVQLTSPPHREILKNSG